MSASFSRYFTAYCISVLLILGCPNLGLAFKVVLDPGHGGSDNGAIFKQNGLILSEKELTLALATQAAELLRSHGYSVTLTRTTDQDIALGARTTMANKIKADVFISIHMNASPDPSKSSKGIETYILNNTTDETSTRLAHFENNGGANAVLTRSESANPDVALILKDLRLDANLAESKRMACIVQKFLVRETHPFLKGLSKNVPAIGLRNRGVRQALFYILLGADMPSLLVEAGFLSHPLDRALIVSPQGQGAFAQALLGALNQFRKTKGTMAARRELSTCIVH